MKTKLTEEQKQIKENHLAAAQELEACAYRFKLGLDNSGEELRKATDAEKTARAARLEAGV
jgi:hypothetical protein